MVQDNSLMEQTRHSEQLTLQQLQLAELQKISSKLAVGTANASTSGQSAAGQAINATATNANMPTNMMQMESPQNNSLLNFATMGGLAIKSGVSGINNGASIGKGALDRGVSYIERMQNSPFFAYKSIDWTRTNMQQAEGIQLQTQHKLQNAGLKVATGIGEMGLAAVGGAVGGGLGGPIGMIAGTIGGSVLGSVGGDQIMKHIGVQQGYESWLQQNSGRFINLFESNDKYGNGFSRKEEKELAKTLSKMNTDFYMSDDELFTMLNQVTDAGLMKSASDMKSFEKNFKGLVQTIKDGAKMLNMSYEQMTELYGEWNKMGIKTDAERADMAAKIKALSSATGLSELDASEDLASLIESIRTGNTLDAADASKLAQSNISFASLLREEKLLSEDSLNFLESRYGSDDTKFAEAMLGGLKGALGDVQIKNAAITAMTLDENGNVVVDKEKLDTLVSDLQSGKRNIFSVLDEAGNIRESGALGASFSHQFDSMSESKLFEMLMEGAGDSSTNRYINTLIDSMASLHPSMDRGAFMVESGIASDLDEAQIMTEWMSLKQGGLGDAVETDTQAKTVSELINNRASSEFGLSWIDRAKNTWEKGWQGVTSVVQGASSGIAEVIPQSRGIGTAIKDFWTDTDEAIRNGYSSAEKVNIAEDRHKDVFNEIEERSSKLREEFGIELSSSKETSDFVKGADTFLDVLISPTRWGTGIKSLFSDEVELANTGLTGEGPTVKKLRKKIDKSDTMTDEEKEALLESINQAQGQTQDIVNSSLNVVTALGGRDSREKMLKSVTIDTATQVKTGAGDLTDFTNEKVLEKMSLSDQQKIQELAIEQAIKEVTSKYGNDLKGLEKVVQDGGYAISSEKIQGILEGGIQKEEIGDLVKEMMTKSQGVIGESETSKILGTLSETSATNAEAMNKNMTEANENIKEVSTKLEDFTGTLKTIIQNLFKTTDELERKVNSKF